MKYERGSIWWLNNEIELLADTHVYKGNRPVLIASNDIGNSVSPIVTVIPLSRRGHEDFSFHVPIDINESVSWVHTEQIITVDKRQLVSCLGVATEKEMEKIDEALHTILNLA